MCRDPNPTARPSKPGPSVDDRTSQYNPPPLRPDNPERYPSRGHPPSRRSRPARLHRRPTTKDSSFAGERHADALCWNEPLKSPPAKTPPRCLGQGLCCPCDEGHAHPRLGDHVLGELGRVEGPSASSRPSSGRNTALGATQAAGRCNTSPRGPCGADSRKTIRLLEVADSCLLKHRPPRVRVDEHVVRNVEIADVCCTRLGAPGASALRELVEPVHVPRCRHVYTLHVIADPFSGVRRALALPRFERVFRKYRGVGVADDLKQE